MKIMNLIAGTALLVTGYFVGFYEYKYKVIKCMLEGKLKEQQKDDTDKERTSKEA